MDIPPGGPPWASLGRGSVQLSELQPWVDFDQVVKHLETLHRDATGAICIVRAVANRLDLPYNHRWQEMLDEPLPIDDDVRHAWERCIVDGRERWQFYTALSSYRRPPGVRADGDQTWYSRSEKYVKEVPGVWADLDVKPGVEGHFQTRDELDIFMSKLPHPTMLVDSGSGGCHAYWLLDQRMTGGVKTKNTLKGWHEHLQETAGSVLIDNVQETARILRLAGTVRWSKTDEVRDGAPSFTRVVLRYADGPRYTIKDLRALCEPAFERRQERERREREAFTAAREALVSSLEHEGLERGNRDYIEHRFNLEQDWGPLLEKAGWTLATDNRGTGGSSACRYWSRPGVANGRASASTDWQDRQTMSLFSTETPHLRELVDPTIPTNKFPVTTKYRFALVTLYDGDEERLIIDIHANGGTLL